MEPRVFAGKYVVERELHEATSGRTFLATGPDGERVVVKVVHPVDGTAASAVERDVDLISGIRHDGLPTVHEWGHEGPDFFMVRDYVPGADLELELGQQGKFAPLTAARYAATAADALAQIHQRGLVHGNVKTANLIRTPEDQILLVGNSLGLAGPTIGLASRPEDAHYVAPEQAEGGAPVTAAADVYAMGVVLWELITGHVPFDAATAAEVVSKQAHEVLDPIREIEADVTPALESVIMRALEKSPEARYADGAALRDALRAAVSPPKPQAVAAPAPRKSSVWPWVIGALLLAAALGVLWATGMFTAHEIVVPDVVGMTQQQAVGAVEAMKLHIGVVTYSGAAVTGVPDGSVVTQIPASGTKVDPATRVDLTLAGVQPVKVPDVVGKSLTQATVDLQGVGLVVGTVTSVTTAGVAPGQVLSQAIAGGQTLAAGSAVDLQVSQDKITVPNVVGVKQAAAEAALKNAGFVVSVETNASTSVASGRVIDQNPTAGVTAQTGSTVTIIISTGPNLVTVPDVVTMTQANAVNALTAAGFKSNVVLQTGGGTVGTVIVQNPLANAKAVSGSTVTITVVQ